MADDTPKPSEPTIPEPIAEPEKPKPVASAKPEALDDPEVQRYVNILMGSARKEGEERGSKRAIEAFMKEKGIDENAITELTRLRNEEQERILQTSKDREEQLRKQAKFEELLATKENEFGVALEKKDSEIARLTSELSTEREARKKDRLRFSTKELLTPHMADIFPQFVPFAENALLERLAFDGDDGKVVAVVNGTPVDAVEYVKQFFAENPYALRKTVGGGSGTLPSSSPSSDSVEQEMKELMEKARGGDRVANAQYLELRRKVLAQKKASPVV